MVRKGTCSVLLGIDGNPTDAYDPFTMVTNAYPLTVSEVATITRVKDKTVRRWMHEGSNGKRLGYRQLPNGMYLIPHSALTEFLGWDVNEMSQPQQVETSDSPA